MSRRSTTRGIIVENTRGHEGIDERVTLNETETPGDERHQQMQRHNHHGLLCTFSSWKHDILSLVVTFFSIMFSFSLI